MVVLTLIGCSGTVPEEDPLQALVTLELVFEAEGVVLVGELEEVCQERLEFLRENGCASTSSLTQQLSRSFMDCERRTLGVVNQDRDTTCKTLASC